MIPQDKQTLQIQVNNLKQYANYHKTRTSGAYGPLVLAPAEGPLSFCLFLLYFLSFFVFFCIFYLYFLYFFSFFLFAFLPFCLFAFLTFLSFCLFVTTIIIMRSISTTTPIFQCYHTFYHKFYQKPLPLLPPTPSHNVFCA